MSVDRTGERSPWVAVLNGPSGAGKTTVARAIQARGGRVAVVSIDDVWRALAPGSGAGWETFAMLTCVLFQTARAWHRSGYDVVVDTVFERADCVDIAREAFCDCEVCWVGLGCDDETLRERARARGDRFEALGVRQAVYVHDFCDYDVWIDTHEVDVGECARRVLLELSPG